MKDPVDNTSASSVLGMKTELYGFVTGTLIAVDVFLVTTLTITSVNRLLTFFLYISFPVLAIISMRTIERINKTYPFTIFCSIGPFIFGALCYYSGLACPTWLTAFPLVTITVLLLDSLLLKLFFLLLYVAGMSAAFLLLNMPRLQLLYIVLGIAIYSAVLERCQNYFRLQQKRIEEQKIFIEEKNKEVMDSIHYAKRIQTSLLPTMKFIQKTIDRLKGKK